MRSKRRVPADNNTGAEASGISEQECLRVQERVWETVEAAAGNGSSIAVLKVAGEIGTAFPGSGLSTRDIADALVFAAVDAGAVVERPAPRLRQVRLARLPRLSFGMLRTTASDGAPASAEVRLPA